ncbi:hypothetical protein OGAPHI_005292 [Ogataea philodendri]|uniref:Type 2A phosphatase activator TIP41 n=1 Tax=Ogataea philodendri TaxID=1378263 RepID=A0A9P8T372_9ASCO|nr:uncharacterized protein OGAPHI_005292 [Ogataea philodendri]KAH3663889.1 hypothetical protein OGAPHI_005292 [Ogataea philodendri]
MQRSECSRPDAASGPDLACPDSIQIDAARQMHRLTTSSRLPQRPARPPVPKEPVAKPPLPVSTDSPSCASCGTVITPSPVATLPLRDTPSINVGDWKIYTARHPILNASEIDEFESILNLPVPEMIFGNNRVRISHPKLEIDFCALDALKLVEFNPPNLIQVSYASEWVKSRQHKHYNNSDVVLEMYKPFDWTYSTLYKGLVSGSEMIRDDTMEIPLEKLKRQDPILFFDEMVLYEDELGDNGISALSIKIRVMHSCLLLLQRLFVRVDNVLLRIYDTRVYIDFEQNLVIREFKKQELEYDKLFRLCTGNDPRKMMRDINWCSQRLPVVSVEREYAELS